MVDGFLECHSEEGVEDKSFLEEVNSFGWSAWVLLLHVYWVNVIESFKVLESFCVCDKAHLLFVWRSNNCEDESQLVSRGERETSLLLGN